MLTLHLNLFGHFWDDINAGIKTHEYRLASIWLKRLDGKDCYTRGQAVITKICCDLCDTRWTRIEHEAPRGRK